ncbi:MBL fold metallo-hydrolase [Rhodoblastus acidophilus]|uniref:MBL fold metallo-hydrolase n=1 Tax=Candidatus Rhodoblastus alkanivorans TaxID=2954117 RepID=A0ABS9ZAI6_9HYPH|nr:MBL fold metallo-hydrolase [Candidatus Rhodoblastus alkanivorans]MCI4680805.1 MBL fold metallo-hydrolase [Candidatus Rhodoblastus alkanivorans]MCI4683647.1 MBL fold metallo-hydrolase [Candidatus Rhodoblastus alkanivorans]MDI4640963.1 MBL fold metallo-hydrolase [Rhodoblastus acidophilus]
MASSALAALLSVLGDGARPARAEALAGAPPEVDRLDIRILVDSYQFAVAPGHKRKGAVEIDQFGWGIQPDKAPGRTLVSEFGLAMLAQSTRGSEKRLMLQDFAFTPEALINNMAMLGVDPSELDAMALSHGHYDHFGGMAGFLQKHGATLKPGLPLYVGGEEAFCSRTWTGPPVKGDFGAIDRNALAMAKVKTTFTEGPALIADHGFTTGPIGEKSFEKILSPSVMKIGIANGFGCYADKLPEDERAMTSTPDKFRHEIATAYNVKGRGLVVLTSCSHRGVVNAVKQAQAVSGIMKVHAVIGGYHLAPYKEDYVRQTIAALKELDVDYIVPLHCTGEPFYDLARAEMPDKVLRAFTGTRLTFGA